MLVYSSMLALVSLFCLAQATEEPNYVTKLRKLFEDPSYTGTYYRRLSSVEDLESTSKDVFRTFLKDKNYKDIEQYFNEWKNTYSNDGPFDTVDQRKKLAKEITNPSHFLTSLQIENLLTNRDDAKKATRAYKAAFVSREEAKVILFYLGDGDIMHGVLIAGVRKNMDAAFVAHLMD